MRRTIAALAIAAAALIPAATPATAQDFFDTSDADQLFTFGARIGVNTSNRTLSTSSAMMWNQNSWGTGFDAGVVADINFKNFISVQPGFFYESRSGAFAYKSMGDSYDTDRSDVRYQLGKGREYLFTIPVVGSVHFNLMDDLRWNVDFGPYFQFKLRSTFDHKFDYPMVHPYTIYYYDNVRTAKFDVGLKMGMGLDIFRHYYVGVHYLAGLCHAWNPGELGGHNKAWLFTVGYNF